MLYEVITLGFGREKRVEYLVQIFFGDPLSGVGNVHVNHLSVMGQTDTEPSRITSYNVCYTKLLRNI